MESSPCVTVTCCWKVTLLRTRGSSRHRSSPKDDDMIDRDRHKSSRGTRGREEKNDKGRDRDRERERDRDRVHTKLLSLGERGGSRPANYSLGYNGRVAEGLVRNDVSIKENASAVIWGVISISAGLVGFLKVDGGISDGVGDVDGGQLQEVMVIVDGGRGDMGWWSGIGFGGVGGGG
ncbi:hypothetical protein Tco_0077657 [Tanacetum coccineum]